MFARTNSLSSVGRVQFTVEAESFDVINTKVLRVFLLAIPSHLVCNVNIVQCTRCSSLFLNKVTKVTRCYDYVRRLVITAALVL
jgi:hypothetical protein